MDERDNDIALVGLMRSRIKNTIGWAAICLLVGGAIAQSVHATPTRAEKIQLQLLQFDVSADKFITADASGGIISFGDVSKELIVSESTDENAQLKADPTLPYYDSQFILQQPNDGDVIATSALSPFAKDFLNKFAAYTGRGKPFAPYIISSAFLISKFEISESFFECNAALSYKRIAEGYKDLKVLRENLEAGEYGHPMYPGALVDARNIAFFNAYFAFRSLAIDPQTLAIQVKDINEKVRAANSAKKLIHLLKYTQECDLEKITIENRISAITLLEPENEEEIIVKLIASVNYNNQAGQLLEKLFVNKSALFKKIWTRLYDGGFFNQTFDEYINKVIEIDKTDNLDNVTLKTFSFERSKDQSGSNANYSLHSIFNNDGTVTIKYIYADNNSGTVLQEFPFSSLDEWVKVKFPKENAFLYWTDPQETDLEVELPVYYIAYLIDKKEAEQIGTAVRLLGNVAAILLAAPTGGASVSILAGISAGLATADLVVLFNEDQINDTEDGRKFLAAWQVVTAIDAAAGGTNLLRAIFKASPGVVTKIGFKFNELTEVLKTLPQNTKQQILTKLREMPELLSRMNMEPLSRLFTNRILSEFEGAIIKSSFNSNTSTLTFKNWVEGTVKVGNQESKIFELGFTSNGGYCKFSDLRTTTNSSNEVIARLDNVRYQQTNGIIGEESFNIVKNSDGSIYTVLAKGADVPTGLVSKLTQQGSTKLKSWLSSKTLSYADNTGAKFSGTAAETKIFNDLDAAIGNKGVVETIEDAQGRLLVRTDATAITETKVISLEVTTTGEYKLVEYKAVYSKGGQSGYPKLSANRLAPDFSDNINNCLHPDVVGKKIEITVTGQMNSNAAKIGDVELANQAAGIAGKSTPTGYTWHHLDDFNPATGKCTMQLVKSAEHQKCRPHTGGVKQWENFFGQTYLRN